MICCSTGTFLSTIVSMADSRFRSFFTFISFLFANRNDFDPDTFCTLSINLDQYPPKINPACSFHATAKQMTLDLKFSIRIIATLTKTFNFTF